MVGFYDSVGSVQNTVLLSDTGGISIKLDPYNVAKAHRKSRLMKENTHMHPAISGKESSLNGTRGEIVLDTNAHAIFLFIFLFLLCETISLLQKLATC
jgi:hypothetical protein